MGCKFLPLYTSTLLLDRVSQNKCIELGSTENFGLPNELFLTVFFYEYLLKTSWYRAGNFNIVSLLQLQHILNISYDLNVPGQKPIFDGGGEGDLIYRIANL